MSSVTAQKLNGHTPAPEVAAKPRTARAKRGPAPDPKLVPRRYIVFTEATPDELAAQLKEVREWRLADEEPVIVDDTLILEGGRVVVAMRPNADGNLEVVKGNEPALAEAPDTPLGAIRREISAAGEEQERLLADARRLGARIDELFDQAGKIAGTPIDRIGGPLMVDDDDNIDDDDEPDAGVSTELRFADAGTMLCGMRADAVRNAAAIYGLARRQHAQVDGLSGRHDKAIRDQCAPGERTPKDLFKQGLLADGLYDLARTAVDVARVELIKAVLLAADQPPCDGIIQWRRKDRLAWEPCAVLVDGWLFAVGLDPGIDNLTERAEVERAVLIVVEPRMFRAPLDEM